MKCKHEFKTYQGFTDSYEYCAKCDVKKEDMDYNDFDAIDFDFLRQCIGVMDDYSLDKLFPMYDESEETDEENE